MGLDQWLYGINEDEDFTDKIEICRWRKHHALDDYIIDTFMPESESHFNCQYKYLSKSDIRWIIKAVENGLPIYKWMEDYYEGEDLEEIKKVDLGYLHEALEYDRVYYNTWW